MKLKTNKTLTVEITPDEIATLFTRLIEKKTGKKVNTHTCGSSGVYVFELVPEEEITNLDEPKV
jgi:hypothetical protein